jgi:hypothetical protein
MSTGPLRAAAATLIHLRGGLTVSGGMLRGRITDDELAIELKWLGEHTGGHPYVSDTLRSRSSTGKLGRQLRGARTEEWESPDNPARE